MKAPSVLTALILASVLVSAAAPAAPADPLVSRLVHTRMTLDWEAVPLDRALEQIGAQARVSFVITSALRDREMPQLNLKLSKIRVMSLLRILQKSYSVEFLEQGGVVLVTSPEDRVRRTAVLRIYDVSTALYRAPDFIGPEIVLRGSEGFDDYRPEPLEEEREPRDIGEILDLLRNSVEPETWDFEGVSIDTFGHRKIVVRHTPEVHRKIQSVLRAVASF